jgi:hypothetical protein
MTFNRKLLGLALGASLLIGFEPAIAAPVAATQIGAQAAVSGDHVVKTTVAGRRTVRRTTTRRAVRR